MTTSSRMAMEEVLVGGLADWTDVSWAAGVVRPSEDVDPGTLRDSTLALISDLLSSGLVVAGDIVAGRHVPWNADSAESVDRISREWIENWEDEVPTPGAIGWLDNTAAGDELARSVWAREGMG